ncbi:TetR/AcrR family transcriptional regulator [Streptomyces roseoverticillatus]|uniref:TetR/AcrR family transcriptional regulator n=1 Tax=Streptomyces roseoverticillatus TaxID=66429 RepID=UPI001F38C425|nr:TetR/AcrR family transcriptional regulator [Streptomyces roseoverticillatus]MCF3105268.1 TetR/AcrR family transcriptional regulator [Streptomyces roseoverticillatus]
MDITEADGRLLDAAEALFYEHGIQAVGMDRIRAASGVSLKRLYQCFPSKDVLVEAYLRRRDGRWRGALAEYVDARPSAAERPLAVFDWLEEWFGEPDFRGCAFINAYGELGAASTAVADAVRDHKAEVLRYLHRLVSDAGAADPGPVAEQLAVLADGAITTAAITGTPAPARSARQSASAVLEAAGLAQRQPAGRPAPGGNTVG